VFTDKELLLDFHLPIFTLLEMFGYHQHKKVHITILDSACPLDWMINTTNYRIQIDETTTSMCAPTALIGMGWLGARHYETQVVAHFGQRHLHRPHNLRRSVTFRNFQTFLKRQVLGIIEKATNVATVPVTLLLSPHGVASESSGTLKAEMHEGLSNCTITWVESLPPSFSDQVELALSSKIYVVLYQEVPESAMLLPQGSVLIVIGSTTDWDIWNNVGHVRVHWLTSCQSLLILVRDELDRIQTTRDKESNYTEDTVRVFKDFIPGPKFPGTRHARLDRVIGSPPPGRVHCIGENFDAGEAEKSWFRTCRYENMCLDIASGEFTLYNVALSAKEELLNETSRHLSSWPTEVIMASQPHQLTSQVTRWKPVVRNEDVPSWRHQLHDHIVWISYKEWDVCNIGRLM
jgi:hypothetical protein